jgi:hypothetical protein
MRGYLRGLSCLVFTSAVVGGLLAAGPVTVAGASTSGTTKCSGTPSAPGTLKGTHANVVVNGVCFVDAGPAIVTGNLTVSAGSGLVAAFALNDTTGTGTSSLTVKGNLQVNVGAALVMGCNPANFACLDDPNQSNPTLSSHATVGLDLRSFRPLGVLVHNFTVGGDVIQTSGGGGVNCKPQGLFKFFHNSPVYSTYEVGKVGGDMRISGYLACWMGVVQVHVGNTMAFTANRLADPDAIEILANHIKGSLICRRNSMVWNSSENGNGLFPRTPHPNTVGRNRIGQCVLASPTKPGGPLGPGPF